MAVRSNPARLWGGSLKNARIVWPSERLKVGSY
jgi:hypothetical protein